MIDRLRRLRARFSALETQLLAAVRRALPAEAQATFDAQVAAVNHVQRSPPSWSEIAFYRKRWGRVVWTGVPLFPNTGEFRLAEVRFAVGGRRFTSTLTCIGGHVFDFATAPGPRAVADATWDREPAVRLLQDPLLAAAPRPPEPVPAAWTDVVRRVSPPPGAWHLYDASTAYRVALDDGEYLVLAEREGDEFLLCRLEPPGEGWFHLRHHDGVPEPLAGGPDTVIKP